MILSTVLAAAAVMQSAGSYRVHLNLDCRDGTLRAEVTVTLPTAPADVFFLLGQSFQIQRAIARRGKVEISQSTAEPRGTQTIEIRRASSGPLHLQIAYAGRPSETDGPPIDEVSNKRVELNVDGFWVPIQKGFSRRFSAHTVIHGLPRRLTIVAQGHIRRANEQVFIDRDVPDIDISFVAEPGLRVIKAPGFQLYAQNPGARGVQLFSKHGAAAVKFLTNWFGAMPGAPSRIVVVTRERKSGYARIGYIVVHEDDGATESAVAKYIAHELSHAWWAPVDPTTEDRWLSESIAEYVALRYVEHALGVAAYRKEVDEKKVDVAAAGPLLGRGSVGDAELYAKGPLLLIDLERRIGRDRLDEVLRRLAHKPPHTTAEFMSVLSAVAGAAAAASFERSMRS